VAVRQVHKSQQINGDIVRFPGRSLHLGWIDAISCPMVETKPDKSRAKHRSKYETSLEK
jgi:hypothetical protein